MKAVVDERIWLATQPSTSEADLVERLGGQLERGHLFMVCDAGEEIVGCTAIHPTKVKGVWSLGTWILPAYRGLGLGRKLLDAAIAGAAAEGARKVELEVFTDNDAAIALYRAAGFEIEGLRRDHYEREDGSVKSATVMALFPGKLRGR